MDNCSNKVQSQTNRKPLPLYHSNRTNGIPDLETCMYTYNTYVPAISDRILEIILTKIYIFYDKILENTAKDICFYLKKYVLLFWLCVQKVKQYSLIYRYNEKFSTDGNINNVTLCLTTTETTTTTTNLMSNVKHNHTHNNMQ